MASSSPPLDAVPGDLVLYHDQKTPLPPWRLKLQRTLLTAMTEIELMYHSARHFFIIPDNSVVNKLPYFNQAVGQERHRVLLSQPLQALVRASKKPRPTQVYPRNKPRYLINVKPGWNAVLACNVIMMYILANAPLIDW